MANNSAKLNSGKQDFSGLLWTPPVFGDELPQAETPVIDYSSFSEEALDWYAKRIDWAKAKGPFANVEDLTSDIARLLLSVNPDNRSLKTFEIDRIVSDIINDRFMLNGETIVVADDGLLNDGQNRLNAIVRANQSVRSFVVFGVSRESRRTMDLGTVKTTGDFIRMEKGANSNIAAVVSLWLMLFERGIYANNRGNSKVPTKPEVLSYYIRHRGEIDRAVKFVKRTTSVNLRADGPLAVGFVIANRTNRERAADFFESVVAGAGFEPGSPAHILTRRLISEQRNKRHTGEKLELVLRAWRAYLRGDMKLGNLPINGHWNNLG